MQRNVLERFIEAARGWGGETLGVVDSGLPGPKGNREFFVHLANTPDAAETPMTSTAGSQTPSTTPRNVARAAVVTHGKPEQIGAGLARLQAVAQEHGVEIVFPADEAEKQGLEPGADATRPTSRSSSAATGRCSAR